MEDGKEVVDLTSPDDPPTRKRRRSSGPIDLVDSEDEADQGRQQQQQQQQRAHDPAAAAEEAQARQRIMEHARKVNRERGISSSPLSAPLGAQLPSASSGGSNEGSGAPSAEAVAAQETGATPLPTNRLLAQLHAERMARMAQRQQQQTGTSPAPRALHAPSPQQQSQRQAQQQQQQPQQRPQQQPQQQPQRQPLQGGGDTNLSLLTWNVWFNEEVHVEARMAAIGAFIQARRPTFVCLQEVTPLIFQIFASSPWWPAYHCSPRPSNAPYFTLLLWSRTGVQGAGNYAEIPFENSRMGRDLKTVAGRVAGRSIRVATTHLESPVGWNQPFREARQAQLKQSAAVLDRAREEDVLLAGDMNWSPDDGVPPLPGGWTDAFLHLHAGSSDQEGLTYDARANPMLKPTNRLRRRLDRIFCKLRRWRPASLELVGRQALPGLQHDGRPVLPSDHFGLLLQLRPAG